MSKKNIVYNDISIVDEGFDTKIGEEISNLRKEYRSALKDNDTENKWSGLTKLIILCIWIFLYRQFIHWEFGTVYFFASIIVLIFTNLGKRKPWELSAYSVFNPNFERLPGTLTSEAIQGGLGIVNNMNNTDENEETRLVNNQSNTNNINNQVHSTTYERNKSRIKENAKQSLNSLCSCDSGKKYKNCCAKELKEE